MIMNTPNRFTSFKNVSFSLLILSISHFLSCSTPKEIAPDTDTKERIEKNSWIIPEGPEQNLRPLTWDLHHQKLWISFDFEKEEVIGKTEMFFTSDTLQSQIVLDAKTMAFNTVYDIKSDQSLSFEQDSAIVTLSLHKEFSKGDTLVLGIDFVSSPPQRGLYFVNPRGEDPALPTQVWTLGQPEDNSFWFPTIDHPSERTTQETWITVPRQYSTLSNGLLLESRILPGDTLRTDYWRLHQPHTPYLFVIAVGEYKIKEELKNGLLYRYYVEPDYYETASLIYENSADMIRFCEKMTGIPWPWDPVYAQAPVRNFIARGMENTTATLLYDAVQFDRRGALDLSNQDLLMHEIIHQWIGNLVTAKDWANLPINEGFANYFEAAYRLYNNGEDSWLWHHHTNRMRYFDEASRYRRPVIFNQYRIPEDMYDRHTYQKAGQVFRMLHDYLGDDIWWKGVRTFLEKFSFKAVDIDDVQYVMEKVSGENLAWFFKQWFLMPGHPDLRISQNINNNEASLTFKQIQDTTRQPIFRLFPEIHFLLEDGETVIKRVELNNYVYAHYFSFDRNIIDIIIDPEKVQLMQTDQELSPDIRYLRLYHPTLSVRYSALQSITKQDYKNIDVRNRIIQMAKDDPWWSVRREAYKIIGRQYHRLSTIDLFELMKYGSSKIENHHLVRIEAMNLIHQMDMKEESKPDKVQQYLIQLIGDDSYFVAAHSITLLSKYFPEEASEHIMPFVNQYSYQDVINNAISEAIIEIPHKKSFEILFLLANNMGNKKYRHKSLENAIKHLDKMKDRDKERFFSLFIDNLNDPYEDIRLLSYEAIKKEKAKEYADILNDILEHKKRSTDERKIIKEVLGVIADN